MCVLAHNLLPPPPPPTDENPGSTLARLHSTPPYPKHVLSPHHEHPATSLPGADPEFSWGGGGRKRLCAKTQIAGRGPGPLSGPRKLGVILTLSCAIWALSLSMIIRNRIKKKIIADPILGGACCPPPPPTSWIDHYHYHTTPHQVMLTTLPQSWQNVSLSIKWCQPWKRHSVGGGGGGGVTQKKKKSNRNCLWQNYYHHVLSSSPYVTELTSKRKAKRTKQWGNYPLPPRDAAPDYKM